MLALALSVLATAAVSDPPPANVLFVQDGTIWSMRANGTERRALIRGTGVDHSGGSRIAFLRQKDRTATLWVAREDGSEPQAILSDSVRIPGAPKWSPDGTLLAFPSVEFADEELITRIEVVAPDGTGRRVVRTFRAREALDGVTSPVWWPGGERLGFTRTVAAPDVFKAEIHTVQLDGADPQLFLADAQGGDWSPDGTRFAFGDTSTRYGSTCGSDTCFPNAELAVVDANGANRVRLTKTTTDESDPSWSVDGQRIAFSSGRNTPELPFAEKEIYTVAPDGSCLTWLTNGNVESSGPVFTVGKWPDAGGCGDRGVRPLLTAAPDRDDRRALWVGPRLGNGLFTETFVRGRTGIVEYLDCAAYEPKNCPPAFLLDQADACRPDARLRFVVRRLRSTRRVGGAVVAGEQDADRGLIFAGRAWLYVQVESPASKARRRALYAHIAGKLQRIGGGPPGRLRIAASLRRRLPANVRRHFRAC